MSERTDFRALREQVETTCRDWWIGLLDADPATGKEKPGGQPNRAALAALRRTGIVSDGESERVATVAAFTIDAYWILLARLRGLASKWREIKHWEWLPEGRNLEDRIAVVATTLARVREDRPDKSTAELLGAKASADDQPLMAEARFKRLIRTRTLPDLLDQGRRIVMLLGREAPVGDLGASLLFWNVGPHVIRQWAFDYYNQPDAAPEADDETRLRSETATA